MAGSGIGRPDAGCAVAHCAVHSRMDYIGELRATISRVHGCQAAHSRTESVKEVINGQVLFEGRVEVFALLGHDRALRCYAWGHLHETGQWEVTTVLAIPPIVSSSTAVLAAVAAKIREHESESGAPRDARF